jgi:phage terminase large subunit-like protein
MTALNFELLKWQQEVFKSTKRFKVVAAGRRCGKSRLSAVTLLIEGLNCPEGSAVMYIAPTLGQARTIMWDLLNDLGRPVIKSSHVNNLEISLINGRKILVRGADNPDSLRGVSLTYVVLDECAFVKEDTWQKIIRASLSDRKGRALFISTPSGRNWFYDLFNLGQEETDEEWQSWHFTTQDNETIDPKEIEAAKRTLSSFAFKQEYLSSFDTAGSDLFKEEWLKYKDEPQYGDYVIAIDLAGFEDVAKNAGASKKRLDESAITVCKILDNGDWWVKKIIHGRWDIRETASKILLAVKEYQPVAVGIERGALKNAVMHYLQDLMRKNNVYTHIHDLTHGNKKKTDRVVWALQGRFEHGRISLNKDEDWKQFEDQYIMFPATGVHDDLIDSLAYVDQLAMSNYQQEYEEDEHEVLDIISGY